MYSIRVRVPLFTKCGDCLGARIELVVSRCQNALQQRLAIFAAENDEAAAWQGQRDSRQGDVFTHRRRDAAGAAAQLLNADGEAAAVAASSLSPLPRSASHRPSHHNSFGSPAAAADLLSTRSFNASLLLDSLSLSTQSVDVNTSLLHSLAFAFSFPSSLLVIMSYGYNCDNTVTNSETVDCVFGYSPNVAAAGLFIGLFGVMAGVHLMQAYRSRSLIPLGLAFLALAEIGGFIARLIVIGNFSTNGFIAMSVLLIIPASLLALANYSTLAKLTGLASDADSAVYQQSSQGNRVQRTVFSLTHPLLEDRRLNPVFVYESFKLLAMTGSIIQIVGINDLISSSSSTVTEGEHLLVGGLSVILFTMGCFFLALAYVVLSPHYDLRLSSAPATRYLCIGMTVTMLILGVRQVYRLVEYALGTGSWVEQHEVMYYVLDATLCLLALVAFAVFDFGHNLAVAEEEMAANHKNANAKAVQMASTNGAPVHVVIAEVAEA